MIRIYIDNVAFTIQKIGGISVVWYELIKRLLKDNNFDSGYLECEDAQQNYYRKLLDISSDKIRSISKRWFKLARYINPKLGIKEPYIFHSTYYRVSRDKSAINVTTVHDFVYERGGSKSLRTKLHIWQQRQAVMKSDVVVCISENTKKDLLHYYKGVDASKIHVVYNGVSDDYFKINDITHVEFPFKPKSYCIYVGVRRAYKNYNLAVEAAGKTGMKLVIIGSPLAEEEKQYLNENLGNGNYICFSRVPNDRLNELYNGAFALLYLSTYEGFGIPCLEAQKAGCPIVACNTSSIPEVCCDKRLLIDKQDVNSVCAKLINLQNPVFYNEIVDKGVTFAKTFSWDRCYNELVQLYNNALNNARKAQ